MTGWDRLESRVEPLRQKLLSHPIYESMQEIENVRVFMQAHVFAVWDFMSLLKALQRELCCVDVPWTPPREPELARLINEIVLAEETDVAEDGSIVSHFDLYRQAMQQAHASTEMIDKFLDSIRTGRSIEMSLEASSVPREAQDFVLQTFAVIRSGHLPAIAAAFTFGREDLLPDVFSEVVAIANQDASGQLSTFCYYLDRHIGLDGDEHGPMAKRLVNSLCGVDDENWHRAEEAVVASLESRLRLWDETMKRIEGSVPSLH